MHPIHRVRRFRITAEYPIAVEFEVGAVQTICFEPVLHGRLFGPLRDAKVFSQVTLDDEAGTLVGPTGRSTALPWPGAPPRGELRFPWRRTTRRKPPPRSREHSENRD